MPIRNGKDNIGYYYQFGSKKKYYYDPNNKKSEIKAYDKASKQGRAIELRKHKPKK